MSNTSKFSKSKDFFFNESFDEGSENRKASAKYFCSVSIFNILIKKLVIKRKIPQFFNDGFPKAYYNKPVLLRAGNQMHRKKFLLTEYTPS